MIAQLKKILIKYGLEWFNVYYSRYRGEIVDNEDPEFRGRLKIKVPQVFGDDVPEYWALPVGMFSGNKIGLFAIPAVGDSVWISFENGDPRYPIWEYGWFKKDEVPDEAKVDGNKPSNIVLQSSTKHRIELDDKNNLIRLTDSNQNIIELNETGVSIVSEKISHGSLDGSAEPCVLGDTAHDLLVEFMNDLGDLTTIVTSTGVTAPISTASNWSVFNSKWSSKWEEFKSQKNTLD